MGWAGVFGNPAVPWRPVRHGLPPALRGMTNRTWHHPRCVCAWARNRRVRRKETELRKVDVEDSVPRVDVSLAEELPSLDAGSDEELFAWASTSTEDDGTRDQFVIQDKEEANEEADFWGDESAWGVESLESSGVTLTVVDDEEQNRSGSKQSGAKRRQEDAAPSSKRWRHRQRAAVLEEELASFLPHSTARRLSRAFTRDTDLDNGSYTPPSASGRGVHRSGLRILSGTRGGLRLLAPQDAATRPMMARVRGAAFDMVLSLAGGAPDTLPPASRWLDLYAGTGAVGIEALSRGAERAEFVEADPWTARNVLGANLHAARAELGTDAVVHVTRAEDFLAGLVRRALSDNNEPTRAFDFVSVCPPYEAVDYTEVFGLLEKAGALHEQTIVLVEYPRKLQHLIIDRLGPLAKIKDRKYGRTFLALYGPG